jgi:hypothetical protein
MTKEKSKRIPSEVKLATQIMRKIGYRIEPATCNTCRFNTKDVPETFSSAYTLACTKFRELVVFGVKEEASCGSYSNKTKKRQTKKQNKSADSKKASPTKK